MIIKDGAPEFLDKKERRYKKKIELMKVVGVHRAASVVMKRNTLHCGLKKKVEQSYTETLPIKKTIYDNRIVQTHQAR